MDILTHPRVKELLLKGRMDDYDPHPANYIDGLTNLIEDFVTPKSLIAEIGSFKGVSSEVFALFCNKLYCIDWWGSNPDYWWNQVIGNIINEAESEFDKVLSKYPNIKKYKGSSLNISTQFPDEYLDLIYIDADHEEANFKQDLETWIKKLKPEGIISGHDWLWVGDYVKQYTHSQFIKTYKDGSWAFEKKHLI